MESILTNLITSIIGSVDNSINEAFNGLMDLCFNAEYTLTHNFGIAVLSANSASTWFIHQPKEPKELEQLKKRK